MSGNKRKRSSHSSPNRHQPRYTSPSPSELPLHARPLRMQAYEADLVRDRPNLSDQLETRSEGSNRGGLIRWGDHDIWVDRFDVRLLLESLENVATPDPIQLNAVNDPLADVGWDDLPSDAEDTFFLSPKEVDEYHHDKRSKMLERGRLDRLRALAEEDEVNGQGAEPPEALWGGSDEEPDDAQVNLMRRTAAHIRASPNAKQLEMRILANHGADPRFAFLRGRWRRAWARMQQREESPTNMEPKKSMMSGLSAYASDSDSGQKSGDEEEAGHRVVHAAQETPAPSSEQDKMEKLRAERRARAKDWARKRREAQLGERVFVQTCLSRKGKMDPEVPDPSLVATPSSIPGKTTQNVWVAGITTSPGPRALTKYAQIGGRWTPEHTPTAPDVGAAEVGVNEMSHHTA